jgi:hypothetical protein
MNPLIELNQAPDVPTPSLDVKSFDNDCGKYLYWKGIREGAKKEEDAFKDKVLAALLAFGTVPDNAPKSKRLTSSAHVATATTSTTVEIDDDATANLRDLMREARLGKFFGNLFTERSEFSLVKDAHRFITTHKWPKSAADSIRLAYLRCFSAKTSSPSLTVETQEEITRKAEEALAELAAKAAKAGKKAA